MKNQVAYFAKTRHLDTKRVSASCRTLSCFYFTSICQGISKKSFIFTIRTIGEGTYRVIRGGSWNNNAQNCRSANRNNNTPDNRNNNIGFRVVLPQLNKKEDGCPSLLNSLLYLLRIERTNSFLIKEVSTYVESLFEKVFMSKVDYVFIEASEQDARGTFSYKKSFSCYSD